MTVLKFLLVSFHILAGSTSILAGTVALFTPKGGRLHRRSGMIFVYAMLAMAGSAAVLASAKADFADALQGTLTFYLVATGLLAVRARPRRLDVAALLVALAVGITHYTFGFQAMDSPDGKRFGYSPSIFFVFGSIAWLSALGDVRMLLSKPFVGARRLSRHLWRMLFGMLIAHVSFFIGQAQVIPEPFRIRRLLLGLTLFPLVMMLFWLVRVRWWRPRRVVPT